MMRDESLHDFYEHAVLPQFGLKGIVILWSGSQRIGPDEVVHYFAIGSIEYGLIFEDYDGLGRNDEYLRENVLEHHTGYSFVEPTSESNHSPSYGGFRLPTPSQYCENVTGTFTLVRLE